MNILDQETVALDDEKKVIRIIDQTLLPGETKIIELADAKEIWDAIYLLQVRGAPAIGVTAGYGIYLLACRAADEIRRKKGMSGLDEKDLEDFYAQFKAQKEYLDSSRPTAVNLSWALKRMDGVCRQALGLEDVGDASTSGQGAGLKEDSNSGENAGQKEDSNADLNKGENAGQSAGQKEDSNSGLDKEGFAGLSADQILDIVLKKLHDESVAIQQEDIATCKAIGEYGLSLVKPGDGLLTHCNAGQLATSKYGTATAPMYLGHERGYNFRVYCDETRPLLQGARLTSYELFSAGLDVTVICDNMSGLVMKKGLINAVFVGCDRVAANGDTANKIGTSVVATVAKRYGVPFYVCAPTSTIDMNTPDGDHIVIEQRPAEEVTEMWYEKRMAPEGVKVFNPAFDVTDNELITAIITEKGIARAPFDKSLAEICGM